MELLGKKLLRDFKEIHRYILPCLLIFQLSICSLFVAATSAQPSRETAGKVRFSASNSTEKKSTFYIDYLLPLYYSEDKGTLLFFNPKQSVHSPSAEETNLGMGLRKIFHEKFILGTHFFFDRRHAHSSKLYSQIGAGLEFLSRPFDFRFNYYDPTTKAKVVDESYEFGSITLVNVKSMEEPLGGYDFEFGFPVYPKELDTRIYFGGFFFNSRLDKDNNGYRVRSETSLNDWLALDMTFNSRNSGETEFICGIRLTIPLESGRVFDKRSPAKITSQNTYIKDRLFERVVRDIDVQSKSSSKKEDVAGIEMIYVDNSKPAGGDGSLEHPYNTLQGAFDSSRYGAGKYIYVFKGDGTNTGYTNSSGYTLADNVVLWGSGYNGGYKGLSAPGSPKIDGESSSVNPVITLGNDNTVMGLDIQHGKQGIYGENISGANIHHNNITNNAPAKPNGNGIYLFFDSVSTFSGFTISNNTITDNTRSAICMYIDSAGTLSDAHITDNTLTNNGEDSVYIINGSTGTVSDFHITGNNMPTTGEYNMCVYNMSTGTMSGFVISDNIVSRSGSITSTYGDGICVWNSAAGSLSDFTFSRNTCTNNPKSGIRLHNVAAGTYSDFTLSNNNVADNNQQGIDVYNVGAGSYSNLTFTSNTATGNTLNGIRLANAAAGTISGATFTGNTVTGNGRGILFQNITGTMSGINLGNGTAGGNNSIYSNPTYNLRNNAGITGLSAQYNWWGQDSDPGSTISGSVTYEPWLSSAP